MIIAFSPRDIRVRPMYPDEVASSYADADGLFWEHPVEIAVRSTTTPYRQAEVLIHEIIHAIWAARGLKARASEETVCTHLGEALATVFRDNPQVLHALVGALNHNEPIVTEQKENGTCME